MPSVPPSSTPWSSEDGRRVLAGTLKECTPQWPDGPHDWQVQATARVPHLLLHKAFRERRAFFPYNAVSVDKPVVLVITAHY